MSKSDTTIFGRIKKSFSHQPEKDEKNEENEPKVSEAVSKAVKSTKGYDRDHIWAFISGHSSQDFRGNPKYLFIYVNKYRPDILAYWLCENEETLEQVRSLGMPAYKTSSPEAQVMINHTGVVAAEQVKYVMPEGFVDVKYINLWHGVGFKEVERRVFKGGLAMELARKYVKRSSFYRDNQLFNATCPAIEKEYSEDCGVDNDKFLRTGYPRCLYQQNFEPVETFDHDLRKIKGLPETTKLVVYAPTYRPYTGDTFIKAIPDFEKLYKFCEEHDMLFIFKVHPYMEKEVGFLRAWEKYGDRKYFWFWDNKYDFYEIMHQMDLAIVDYSGIISDMVAMGVPHYIRYDFDYDEYMSSASVHGNYMEKTTGIIVKTFPELLDAIDTFEERDETAEIDRLNKELWSYSQGKDDFERIIKAALDFKPVKRRHKDLYTFDIFDTLISRKCLDPMGIFYRVREDMIKDGSFPLFLIQKYPDVRHNAELNAREYYKKSTDIRHSERVEIKFDDIFDRIADVYDLNDEQVEKLKKWELEAELDNVIPLKKQISLLKSLRKDENNVVILVSDMYLPKEFIEKLLYKADPELTEVPLFLSNEYGVLKTSQQLYFEVYKSFSPYYDFDRWVHFGDNEKADVKQARKFNIRVRQIKRTEYNDIQKSMVKYADNYDAHLVAAMQARMLEKHFNKDDEFVISYISLCFVPYVDWVIRDAQRKGYKMLYFVSRDGHHMKRIADAIIRTRGLDIKTKYIYGSRRAWRIPSYIDEVDNGFWEGYGNFTDLISVRDLLNAMDLDREKFEELFPFIDLDSINFLDRDEVKSYREIFKHSKAYNGYLLERAAEKRGIVEDYLRQEIDPSEKHAFVEYHGRGYNQDCHLRLWRDITGDPDDTVAYYYCRSVLPSADGSIRYNFTTNSSEQYFIESILANMPYKSLENYKRADGKIEPDLTYIPYDKELFDSMNELLPEFAEEYVSLDLSDPESTDHMLHDFVYYYYDENKQNTRFADMIGHLIDSVNMYGKKRQFAPPYTDKILDRIQNKEISRGDTRYTSNVSLSVTRSADDVRERFAEMYQVLPGESYEEGRLLSEREIRTNEEFHRKYVKIRKKSELFAEYYANACEKTDVTDKIVLLTMEDDIKGTSLELIYKQLQGQQQYEVQIITLKGNSDIKSVAKDLAEAEFIVTYRPIDLLCQTEIRSESREIFLCENVFPLYNKGNARDYFLKWKMIYYHYTENNEFSVMQIPSKEREEFFRYNFCRSSAARCDLLGGCQTDIYFDREKKEKAREKLVSIFPEAEGKKVILYMPTWRRRSDAENWIDMLDLEVLQKLIGDEYVLVLNFNDNQEKMKCENSVDIPGFSKKLNNEMPIRDLMIAGDVIVGDYRDTFYESALMHKPVYFTAGDYEERIKLKNMSCNANDFEGFIFGPIVRSSEQLAEQLKDAENYDYTKMEAFRDKFLKGCDGRSTERVVSYLMKQDD